MNVYNKYYGISLEDENENLHSDYIDEKELVIDSKNYMQYKKEKNEKKINFASNCIEQKMTDKKEHDSMTHDTGKIHMQLESPKMYENLFRIGILESQIDRLRLKFLLLQKRMNNEISKVNKLETFIESFENYEESYCLTF